jgi:hypothetical protein
MEAGNLGIIDFTCLIALEIHIKKVEEILLEIYSNFLVQEKITNILGFTSCKMFSDNYKTWPINM